MREYSPLPRRVVPGSIVFAAACQPEIVPEPYVPTSAHDAYRHSLEETGLSATALGRDWQKGGESALRSPVAPTSRSLTCENGTEASLRSSASHMNRLVKRPADLVEVRASVSYRESRTRIPAMQPACPGQHRRAGPQATPPDKTLLLESLLDKPGRRVLVNLHGADCSFPVTGPSTIDLVHGTTVPSAEKGRVTDGW